MVNKHNKRGAAMRRIALAAVLAAAQPAAQAAVNFNVSFGDPAGTWSAWQGAISAQVVAAGLEWMSMLGQPGFNTTLDVRINFGAIPTANGTSATVAFVGQSGGLSLWEAGAAAKLRNGTDANGTQADIIFTVGINGYLQQELWFDPTPGNLRDDVVPFDRIDARSVFLHEFGHAFGINGWRDWRTARLFGSSQSTFDQYVSGGGSSLAIPVYFNGPQAVALYGGPVPLTGGNLYHLGNAPNSGPPGGDLIRDLMNGVIFYRGTRYQASELDLAILRDIGVPFIAQVPEPGSALLLAGGVALLGAVARRRAAKANA